MTVGKNRRLLLLQALLVVCLWAFCASGARVCGYRDQNCAVGENCYDGCEGNSRLVADNGYLTLQVYSENGCTGDIIRSTKLLEISVGQCTVYGTGSYKVNGGLQTAGISAGVLGLCLLAQFFLLGGRR
uniref:Uncharacterized protein n=1 Tax=Chromera velia CCMP2878 TaxID=1169474 RepID=A0A0G4H8T7_9ALVE|mmetsp:Transcript_47881/g.94467  ORF Transcript_47881/g.94467 Transcript_47881/m.94467 type:complete len:129 (-) Transcript_47881:14-400(-)|eukprot:Cvel_25129.t1-p1 / transcript=Cvel_25129.t1 / gene=Cvel_25129 / organism=Chromera_velia_CCMP2878 / gene_product=hypothetical protein / transcript_product=hypothetical protein / location=Cvel_scaffold2807:19864-21003(-) / protein_length=128 / sequence_SO=supercontig / SO=protein_coding / is_pseudo=false